MCTSPAGPGEDGTTRPGGGKGGARSGGGKDAGCPGAPGLQLRGLENGGEVGLGCEAEEGGPLLLALVQDLSRRLEEGA